MMELIEKGRKELRIECDACYKHYPLLEMLENSIDRTAFSSERFAEYINLIDSQKKNEQIWTLAVQEVSSQECAGRRWS